MDDLDTVGALAPGRQKMVLVHVNGGPLTRRLSIALRGWSTETVIVTDATRHAKRVADTVAPPASIVTLILNRRP